MVSVLAKETNNFAESTKLNTYAGGRKKQNKQKKKKKKKKKKKERKKEGAKFARKVYNGLLWTIQEGCCETSHLCNRKV